MVTLLTLVMDKGLSFIFSLLHFSLHLHLFLSSSLSLISVFLFICFSGVLFVSFQFLFCIFQVSCRGNGKGDAVEL